MSDSTGKNGPKILSPENMYFLKCLLLSTTKVAKKRWSFAQSLSKYLVDSYKMLFPDIFMFDDRRKIGRKNFFIGNSPFFLKNVIFHQPLRSWRIDLITSTVFVGTPIGLLQFVPWGLSHSILREKETPINFIQWKVAFFSKICDSINLLGLKKMLWQALQYW